MGEVKIGIAKENGLLSIDWTYRIERITQQAGTCVRIDWV